MIDILVDDSAGPKMIDFGSDGKVLFSLPVIGSKDTPLAITTSFSMFLSLINKGRKLHDLEASRAWNYFIDSLADLYPEAVRHLGRMNETQLTHVVKHWAEESEKLKGFDPKV